MANRKKTTNGSAPVGSANGKVTVVTSRQQFEQEAQRLRAEGFTEVPGFFGGGGGELKADYGAFINSKLACDTKVGSSKGSFPLLHVSSGYAQPVKAVNGHKGSYITWGVGNKLPNVVSFLCSLSPYTAAALKFNIDLVTAKGPQSLYQYTQYVGGNITTKRIPFDQAGILIKGWIRDLKRELSQLEAPATDGSPLGNTSAISHQTSDISDLADDIREQITHLEEDYEKWQTSNEEWNQFARRNNLIATFQQLSSDMYQFNICFPEFELQRVYTDAATGKNVKTANWRPKITGLKWRNAKTMRLEQMNSENRIEHVYVSNQWLSSPENIAPITEDSDFKIDAMPAITSQSPVDDLEKILRETRQSNVDDTERPTHIVMPVTYNEYGHPYYPVPAHYAAFSGDVYTYASMLVSDRKKRRDNANVIGRILYLNDEYMQRLYMQRGCDTDDKKKKLFKEVIDSINKFLKNRDNMGEPLLAYTFKDSEGKVYKSWEIVEVQENNASQAEANKEELAEISSIILFAWGVDSQLIGNTPGTTTRSGGTDLRERYLLKQVQSSTIQTLMLKTLDVVRQCNGWDDHMVFGIQREVLTTLDNSKTGVTEAETN